MSMWKNIKSLFIIEEEAPAPGPGKPAAASTGKMAAESTGAPQPKGKVTEQFTDVLLRAMSEQNMEGFDYLEFKKSLNSLKQMEMDEATRYQSALAMAQTMGAKPQQLAESAQHYIEVLKKERAKFGEALAKQQKLQVEDKEEHIRQAEEGIKSKLAQIQQLQQEIQARQQEAEALKGQIREATDKLLATQSDFAASFDALAGQIMHDVEKIKQYQKQ